VGRIGAVAIARILVGRRHGGAPGRRCRWWPGPRGGRPGAEAVVRTKGSLHPRRRTWRWWREGL